MGEFLKRLGISIDDLEEIIGKSPSLRGVLVGYLAEKKLVEEYFKDLNPEKPDDHDRSSKGDRVILYKGVRISVEVKSLQTNCVVKTSEGYEGRFQCDASDSRKVRLPNGEVIKTVCLLVGGFDLLAVNLFEFGQKWKFAFVRNRDLPRSNFRGYTIEQQGYLLQTTPKITLPLRLPYRDEPWTLLDEIAQEKALRKR